jgi:hypothetical protein
VVGVAPLQAWACVLPDPRPLLWPQEGGSAGS